MNTTYKDDGTELKWENHWGHYVFSDTPVTGVISCHNLEWIYEETDYRAVANLSYDAYMEQNIGDMTSEWQQRQKDDNMTPDDDLLERWRDELGEYYEESGDTYLIGAWYFDGGTQLWEIDKTQTDPEKSFAAIVNYDFAGGIVQVVWSKVVTRGALCSPCCPGQVDLDTPGDYMGYDLPLSFYGDMRQNTTPQFSVPSPGDKYTYADSTDDDGKQIKISPEFWDFLTNDGE